MLIRAHVDHGVLKYVRSIPSLDEQVVAMVGTHHERFDGEGYPRKLKGRRDSADRAHRRHRRLLRRHDLRAPLREAQIDLRLGA